MDYPDIEEFVGKVTRKNIEEVFPYLGYWVRIEYYDPGFNKCAAVGVLRGIRLVGDSMDTGTFILDGTEVMFDHDEKVEIALVNAK